MLLNRVLTVRPGAPASHRGKGWEAVTECAIRALAAREEPMVAILWGRDASTLKPMLAGRRCAAIESPTPRRCRRAGGFSGHGRSAAPTNCWQGWAPIRWTGGSPRRRRYRRPQPRTTLPAFRQEVQTLTCCLLPPGRVAACTVWMFVPAAVGPAVRVRHRLAEPGPFPQISHTAAMSSNSSSPLESRALVAHEARENRPSRCPGT